MIVFIFFFNDTATTEIYTLSLHDALPISVGSGSGGQVARIASNSRISQGWSTALVAEATGSARTSDRKSTRLNSSHANISYAVFCLKKKKKPLYNLSTPIDNTNIDPSYIY